MRLRTLLLGSAAVAMVMRAFRPQIVQFQQSLLARKNGEFDHPEIALGEGSIDPPVDARHAYPGSVAAAIARYPDNVQVSVIEYPNEVLRHRAARRWLNRRETSSLIPTGDGFRFNLGKDEFGQIIERKKYLFVFTGTSKRCVSQRIMQIPALSASPVTVAQSQPRHRTRAAAG